MQIINEVFATIKSEIILTIQRSNTPYDAARQIVVNYQFSPPTARLLLKSIGEIFNTYNK